MIHNEHTPAHKSKWKSVALTVVCAAMGGCGSALPPPISREQQVQQLTTWSRSLEQIKAKSVMMGMEIKYRNEKGEPAQQNAEVTLLIRQHPQVPGRPGDVMMFGRKFDRTLFEAGRNEKEWWFASYLDPKTAWVGDARVQPDVAALEKMGEGISPTLFRADLVLDLLGLSPLPAVDPGTHPELAMQTTDAPGINALTFFETTEGGVRVPIREIIIDRYTGNVQTVRLNNPQGTLVVESKLSVFRPVTFATGVAPTTPIPEFPRKIQVTYPAQQVSITLELESVEIPRPMDDRLFQRPSFEGLPIVPLK